MQFTRASFGFSRDGEEGRKEGREPCQIRAFGSKREEAEQMKEIPSLATKEGT